MEEFDFDLNNEIGTSVSQLKSKGNQFNDHNDAVNTDTDFDYDKIMEHFNSEQNNTTFNYDSNRDVVMNSMSTTLVGDKQPTEMFTNTGLQIPQMANENRPRKQQNMNKFAKDLENNLDNFGKVNLNEPLPVNFSKSMIQKQQLPFQKTKVIEQMNNNESKKQEQVLEINYFDFIKKFFNKIEFGEIIISMLLFMVLNNKIIIEQIYNKIPYIQKIDSPYPNLVIRTLFFGIILFLIKKFNL